MVNPPLFPILVSLLVDLSVRYGNIASSALIYGCYGVLACNFFKEIEIGVAFGRLATDLDRHPITNTLKGRGMMMCGAFLEHRQAHLNKTLDILSVGYQMSLEVGDVEFVGHNVQMYCFNAFWSGYPLHSLQKETDAYISVLSNANQALQESYTRLVGQVCSNLLGRVEQPWVLIGTNLDESEWIKHLITNREISGLSNFYLYKIFLCFLFEEPLLALDHVANIQEYSSGLGGFVLEAEYYFYSSLVRLATISHNSQEESLDRVTENQLQLRDYWAKYAPMNHQNKVDLVEAEKARVLGNRVEAIELYDCAIAGAKANKYLQEEALANELAAKFYLDWGKEKVASGYMQEAYYCYARWGAKTKTDDLEKRYPQLLQPILQQQLFNFNPKETLALYATSLSTRTNSTSSTNISDVLDFTSVLKAAQAISSSLELDTLIASLTRIILENSGAKKAVLILPQEQTWQVKAMTWMNYQEIQTILEPQSLDHSPDIPIQIIHYVKNTQQTVVIDNCQTDTPGLIGEYMLSHQPQSVLCTPIINQGNLVGIIYLENKLTSGVFTRDRLRVLNFLCAQAAISLENARLYQQSQKYAQQLEQSLSQLQVALRERQQAQTALAKEREFLNAIIHNITDGIVVCDASGKLTLFNKATREFHGLPIESLPPEQWAEYFDLYQPDGHTPLSTTEIPLFRALQGEIVENAEMVIAPKQGSQRILLASGQAIFDPSGNKVGAVVVMRDITDRKKAELALEQKSQALEQALNDLQQAQLQIVQSEKMSALGNLVAGVAHEMNNPLGFISATLQQAQPTVAEILEHLKLYQETFPNSSEQILEHREEIDLDYSLEDLPKMMDAMIIAGDRLKSISTSLRTFSRADKDYKVPFNIHEGIDSTLLILKHRLKANEKRPEIEVIANYGNLPEVQCFPGQLNQVFMNILANAIDALDESNIGLSFAEIQANPNRITIQTSLENEAVKITIGDNGMGMNEEVKQKIFDHLFTTKGVGKGTGLGLAIARQIVVEKHGGEIHVNSILGEGTEFIITLPNEA
jgi:PAS domain S-box-containing protein